MYLEPLTKENKKDEEPKEKSLAIKATKEILIFSKDMMVNFLAKYSYSLKINCYLFIHLFFSNKG